MRPAWPAVAILGLASCRQVLGIPDVEVKQFAVGGTAIGVELSDDDITLQLNDFPPQILAGDGAFRFDATIENESPYTVAALSGGCSVVNGAGVVAGADVTDVQVLCDVSGLADLQFSAPLATEPAFDTRIRTYVAGASTILQQTAIRPVASEAGSPISVLVDGGGVTPDADGWFGPVPLIATSELAITVTPPAAGSRLYSVNLNARPPEQFGYGKASTPATAAEFGSALAVQGDVLVVGAPEHAMHTGTADVYRRAGRSWAHEATLVAAGLAPGDRFGASVAIEGDRIAVGAPGDQADRGSVFVFAWDGTAWTQGGSVGASAAAGDRFGTAVAFLGTLLVVGAPGDDGPAGALPDAGAAFVYSPGLTQSDVLRATNAESGDAFGESVAADTSHVLVGAPGEDSSDPTSPGDNAYPDAGAAYTFAVPTLAQEAYLKAAQPGAADAFGSAVAIDCDGACVIAVGAPLEDSNGSGPDDNSANGAGAVYLFRGPTDPPALLKASNAGAGDGFGSALALRGRLLAIGAPFENSGDGPDDDGARDAGAVYVFAVATGAATQTDYVKASNRDAGDNFGAALAATLEALFVGAPLEDSSAAGWNGDQGGGAVNAGAVYGYR